MTRTRREAPRRVDRRPPPERRVREAWDAGPGPLLAAASCAYRAVAELRNAAWDLGLFRPRRAPIPVISVGGLTVGGSGKTPLTAELAGRLGEVGRVGIVTHGFRDELQLHALLNPGAVVRGGTGRLAAVEAAAEAGAGLALVDGGFQHRRLWRDADVVTLPAGASVARARTLPAGPFREGWSALGRADAAVVVRRSGSRRRSRRLVRWLEGRLPELTVAACALQPSGLRAANGAARSVTPPDPAVAVASIMYPEVFLDRLGEAGLRPEVELVLSDHADVDGPVVRRAEDAAGERGVVGTLKDVVKLRAALTDDVPLWYLREELVWEAGERRLLARLAESIDRDPGRGRGSAPGSERPVGARGA